MYLFQNMNESKKNISSRDVDDAGKWFADQAEQLNGKSKNPFNMFKSVGVPTIGKMYLFIYDPKHKATLPFYDMYPLAFPFEFKKEGFLALNMHYLPPNSRAALMQSLYSIANNDKYNASTKLNISYAILKQSANRFSGFENCIKSYLFGQLKSSFRYVNPADWDKALMLPLQRWVVNPDKKYSSKAAPPY